MAQPNAAGGADSRSPAGSYNPWMIAMVISLAPFMEILDSTIANVALTHIAGTLAASQEESTWILTSYLVSNTVVLPISGWLAQILGRKRFYLICLAIFTASSVACAFATTLPMMLLARVLQGVGGGGLAPITQSMLADSFPPSKRNQAFALYGLTVIVAPAIGPFIGGWLTNDLSWHWIFLINLPVGLIAFTLVSVFVLEPRVLVRERKELLKKGIQFDYLGLTLIAIGFASLQIFLDKFQEDDGFSSSFIVMMCAITVVSLSTLVVWEWNHPQPVMNIKLLAIRNFAIGNIMLFFVGFTLLASTQLLPALTQSLLGYDTLTSGKAMAASGMFMILMVPVAGIVTGRFIQPKWLLLAAFLITGFGLLLQSTLPPNASFFTISAYRVAQVIAVPLLFIPANAVAYIGVPPQQNGQASALINQTRNIGSSVGLSLVTTMLAWRTQFHHERLAEAITPYANLHGLAVSKIAPMVQSQAAFLSYLDMFRLVGFAALLVVPLIFFLKSPSKRAA